MDAIRRYWADMRRHGLEVPVLALIVFALGLWALSCEQTRDVYAQEYEVAFSPPETTPPGAESEIAHTATVSGTASAATSVSVTASGSWATGDFCVANVAGDTLTKSIVTNDGNAWTTLSEITATFSMTWTVLYRERGGSDGGTYSFRYSDSAADNFTAVISCFSGVETLIPFDAKKTLDQTSSAITQAGMLTTADDMVLLALGAINGTNAISVSPSGFTLGASNAGTNPATVNWYKAQASAGSAGSLQFEASGSVGKQLVLLGLRPASTASTVSTLNSPGSATNVDNAGSAITWTNPGNIATSNDTRASSTLAGTGPSDYLCGSNFGFSLPSGATITGIVGGIERRRQGGATGEPIDDSVILLGAAGTAIGSPKAAPSTSVWAPNFSFINQREDYWYYGARDDVWGTTGLTGADLNDADFAVCVAAKGDTLGTDRQANVDHMHLLVYYQ